MQLRSTGLLLAVLALACADAPTVPRMLAAAPSLAAATTTISTKVPLLLGVFIPCANGGAGEGVLLTGNLHIVTHVTTSNSGNFSVKNHFQPQGITGAGLVTGDKYQGTGVSQDRNNLNGPLPLTFTFVNNFRMIGQGPGNNFMVHQNVHVTINANGVVTAFADNLTTSCK